MLGTAGVSDCGEVRSQYWHGGAVVDADKTTANGLWPEDVFFVIDDVDDTMDDGGHQL